MNTSALTHTGVHTNVHTGVQTGAHTHTVFAVASKQNVYFKIFYYVRGSTGFGICGLPRVVQVLVVAAVSLLLCLLLFFLFFFGRCGSKF